jgi:predicted RNase H-like HicB family nuclease
MVYTISIQKNKNGWLTGQCEQLPEAISEGENMDNLMKNMYEVINDALEFRKEDFIAKHKNETRIRRILYFPNEKKRIAKTSQRERVYS